MKNLIITTALLTTAVPTLFAGELSMEEHTMQAVLQMQVAREKSGLGILATVGDEVGCTHRLGSTRIQDAINSGADEVRIASSTYDENLIIDNISITLKGGYDTCNDASAGISNGSRQVISGGGASLPTLKIQGNSQRNTVNLEFLSLQDGEEDGFFAGGGISTLVADLELNLTQVDLSLNSGTLGGGLAIVGGNTDVVMNNTLIATNSAGQGGGIYCSGSEASVFINDTGDGLSGVFNNEATGGDGGGALINSGCTLTSFSGRPDSGFFDTRGFVSNRASDNGGGIAVASGGSVFLSGSLFCFFGCTGDNTRPVNVDFNTADNDNDEDGFGGGIHATGVDTLVNLFSTKISDNTAQSGGGLAVEDQATLNMRSVYVFGSCWSPGSCSKLIDNEISTIGFPVRGGGLYATTGAVVDISNTMISGNRADFGTALYTLSAGADPTVTSLDVEGSLIVNNGANGVDGWADSDAIRINGGNVKLDFNSIADNDLSNTSANINNTGDLDLFSSIIHNSDGLDVYRGAGTLTTDCLMVNETVSLPNDAETILDDPEFIDRVNGDFHLNPSISPAIDFCDTFFTIPDYNDSDNEERGFNDPTATNFLGRYDVGYDETYANDIIFEDDFEG